MRTKREWGDPMSYSDVMIAKNSLVEPNKFICIRCLKQAPGQEIQHERGCPEEKWISKTSIQTNSSRAEEV